MRVGVGGGKVKLKLISAEAKALAWLSLAIMKIVYIVFKIVPIMNVFFVPWQSLINVLCNERIETGEAFL